MKKKICWSISCFSIILIVFILIYYFRIHIEHNNMQAYKEVRLKSDCKTDIIDMLNYIYFFVQDNKVPKDILINNTLIDNEVLYEYLKKYNYFLDDLSHVLDSETRWKNAGSFVDPNNRKYHISITSIPTREIDKTRLRIKAWGDGLNMINDNGKNDDIVIEKEWEFNHKIHLELRDMKK